MKVLKVPTIMIVIRNRISLILVMGQIIPQRTQCYYLLAEMFDHIMPVEYILRTMVLYHNIHKMYQNNHKLGLYRTIFLGKLKSQIK